MGGRWRWRDIERGTERKRPKKTEGGGQRRGGRNRKPDGKKMKERKVFWVKRVGEERWAAGTGDESFRMSEGEMKDGAYARGGEARECGEGG